MNLHKKRSLTSLVVLITTVVFISCKDQNGGNDPVVYAYFEAETQSITTGESIEFEDLSIGYPSTLEWTFEGGSPSTSTEPNPTVTYEEAGQFNVTLTASGEAKSSARTEESYILVISGDYLSEYVVASYPFNGSAEDSGPNSIDAANMGNVTFEGTDRHGNENSAAVFSGSNALIVPNDPAFNFGTDDFSVSVWIKTGETHKMMVWQESGAGGAGDNQAWLRIGDNTSNRLIRFATEDSDGANILNYGSGPDSGVSDGSWRHVVCTREGTNTRLYIDGERVSELERSSVKDISSDQDFKVGVQEGPEGSYHTYFTGALDDLILFDKALTDQEVANLHKL